MRVEVPRSESPRSESGGYEVAELAHEQPIMAGEGTTLSSLGRVIEAEARRERRAIANRYEQTWFNDGERTAALAFIRTRIGRARFSVLVADPYFGANQILQFLHAVSRTSVDFTLLTSRLAFEYEAGESRTEHVPDDARLGTARAPKRDTEAHRLNAFASAVSSLARRGIKNAQALVLVGKTPPLHDRFLVIDGVVWFLGNSLNTLGERASLILQVPDPEPIVRRLERMKAQALPFNEYASRRHAVPRLK